MDIESLNHMYIMILLASALVSGLIGFILTKKFNNHKIGFMTLAFLSFILLSIINKWYSTTFVTILLVTIPVYFNMAGATMVYIIYVVIMFFVYKKFNKK